MWKFKLKPMDLRSFVSNLSLLIFSLGTVAVALKLVTFYGHWVFMPVFPDVLDSTFLVCGVVYFLWRLRTKK
jgi:hypothetical protein